MHVDCYFDGRKQFVLVDIAKNMNYSQNIFFELIFSIITAYLLIIKNKICCNYGIYLSLCLYKQKISKTAI